MNPEIPNATSSMTRVRWLMPVIGGVMALALALALRFGTDARGLDPTWDEPAMQPIVRQLVRSGWAVENSLDYEDTKGPTFFWLYAGIAELVGDDLDDLRLITAAFSIVAGILFGAVCTQLVPRDGPSTITWPLLVLATALFVLLPYQGVLSQLFMSEASFIAGSLLLALIYIDALSGRSRLGPVLFAIVLAIMLHHRVQIVALAGAVCLVAWWRDGGRSWPWWWACVVAVLLRLPLMWRWDGLVSPLYQSRYGLGYQPDNLAYLAIASLPYTWLTLVTILWDETRRRRWVLSLTIAALTGAVLGFVAAPDLSLVLDESRHLGVAASVLRLLPAGSMIQALAIRVGVAIGVAGLASLLAVAEDEDRGTLTWVVRLAGFCMVLGWLLYSVARGDVYDRYLLSFSILLPLVWICVCPRGLLLLQMLLLAGLTGLSSWTWLVTGETGVV